MFLVRCVADVLRTGHKYNAMSERELEPATPQQQGGTPPPRIAEVQSSTVGPRGGGSVWVLGAGLLPAEVAVVRASDGGVVATASTTAGDASLALVSVPTGLAPAMYSLSFTTPGGTVVTTAAVNAPQPTTPA